MAIRLLIILVFFSCNSSVKNSEEIIENIVKNEKVMENDWIKDKNGCLNLRKPELAFELIEEHKLKKTSMVNFIQVFGDANKVYSQEKETVLVYFFNSMCIDDKIIEGSDKCYAKFYFNKDIFISEDYECE